VGKSPSGNAGKIGIAAEQVTLVKYHTVFGWLIDFGFSFKV